MCLLAGSSLHVVAGASCACSQQAVVIGRLVIGLWLLTCRVLWARGACSSIVCDLMLLIEGCTQVELPERMLGGTRLFPFFSFSLFLFLPLSWSLRVYACKSAHMCSSLPLSVSVFVILRMCMCVLACVLVVRERATCRSIATK